jgi:hypothetical protein
MNYIQAARGALSKKIDVEDDLLDLYTLLVFVTGGDTELEHVRDAWAIWRNRTNPSHKSLLPFSDLSQETQQLDRKFVNSIQETARETAARRTYRAMATSPGNPRSWGRCTDLSAESRSRMTDATGQPYAVSSTLSLLNNPSSRGIDLAKKTATDDVGYQIERCSLATRPPRMCSERACIRATQLWIATTPDTVTALQVQSPQTVQAARRS